MSVAVGNLADRKHVVTKLFDDFIIGCRVFDVFSFEDTGFCREVSVSVNRADNLETVLLTDKVVIPSVSRCDVDHTGVFEGDIVCNDNFVLDACLQRNLGCKWGYVFGARKFCSGLGLNNVELLVFTVL